MENKSQFLTQFKGYPSIQLSSNTKFVKNIYNSSFDNQDILWVATQKIHGSNFSISYDFKTNSVKYGRRNDFISNQIPVPSEDITPYFIQNFFDASELINTFHNNLEKIKQNITEKYQKVVGIQIFGQFFGGHWPEKVESTKRVQLGVYYTPNHQFMVFDIRVTGQDYHTWVEVTQIPNILDNYLKYVPIYKQGSLEEILKINSEFDSTIPQLLGLKHLQKNICEGLIIRPNKNLFSKSRVILKKKNQEFLEKAGFGKQKNTNKKGDKKQYDQDISILEQFLNENRVQSAISKHPDFKDCYHLKGYIFEDIFEDAKKQGYLQPDVPKIQKQIHKRFDKIVLDYVVEYLKKQRKQFANKMEKVQN